MAYGEGSIHQRTSDGKYVASLYVGWTEKGTRRRRTKVCATEREAKRELRDMRRAYLTDEHTGTDPRMTVKRYCDQWLESYAERARPRTVVTTRGHVRQWIVPTIGNRRLVDLGAGDMTKVGRAVTAAGRSATTANNVRRTLRLILTDARRDGYTISEAAMLARMPATAVSTRTALTVQQAAAMLAAADSGVLELPADREADKALRDGLRVAAETDKSRWVAAFLQGMRRGECLGLTWDRVDLDAGTVDVSWQLQVISPSATPPADYEVRRLTGSYCLVRPKSRAGQRIIPLVPWMVEALRDWQGRCPETPWGLVWPSAAGNPRRPEYDTLAFRALAQAAGASKAEADHFVLHEARHTTVSILLALGVSPQVIIAIVGHSSFASTERYAHVDLSAARTALEGVAGQLGLTG